jgi:hypothetical protein
MAVRTLREIQAIEWLARFMTFLAGHRYMLPEQRESGVCMAEYRLVHDIPSCRRMAFRAIPVEPALVIDPVTIETFRVLYFCEAHIIGIVRRSAVHDHRVAFLAESLPMSTGQFEVGLVMIEAGSAFPGIE